MPQSSKCWPSPSYSMSPQVSPGCWVRLLAGGVLLQNVQVAELATIRAHDPAHGGLGRAAGVADPDRYEEVAAVADVLVVGGGIAGLSAAVSAARSGADTILLAGGAFLGGALSWRGDSDIDALVVAARRAGVRILTRALAFGVYDHGLVCARESLPQGSARGAGSRCCFAGRQLERRRPRRVARASMENSRTAHRRCRRGVRTAHAVSGQ